MNKKVLEKLESNFFSAIPQIIKFFILRVMHIGSLNALWLKISFTNVFLVRGKERSSNLDLATLIIGDFEFAHYFANLVYSKNRKIQALKKIAYRNISSIIDQAKAEVIIGQGNWLLSRLLSREGFLILPKIDFTLDISSSWEKIFARMSRLRRRNIRTIEKHEYSYEITKEPYELELFYSKMYLPYISKRHRKSAKLSSFFSLNQIFRKGGLLLVKRNGKYVSGIIYDVNNDRVNARYLGIYEGKNEYLVEGAGQAALYFLIKWSKLQGYKEIDYGLSEPFMNDGAFTYKKSWGMKVKPSGKLVLGLRVSNFSTAVLEFLSENPLIFAEPEGLSGLIFQKVEETTEKRFVNLHNSYCTPGLSKIVVVSYSTKGASGQSLNLPSDQRSTEKLYEKGIVPKFSVLWSKHDNADIQCHQIYSKGTCSAYFLVLN